MDLNWAIFIVGTLLIAAGVVIMFTRTALSGNVWLVCIGAILVVLASPFWKRIVITIGPAGGGVDIRRTAEQIASERQALEKAVADLKQERQKTEATAAILAKAAKTVPENLAIAEKSISASLKEFKTATEKARTTFALKREGKLVILEEPPETPETKAQRLPDPTK